MFVLRSNGLDIHYDIHGDGEPMLMVHGFGGTGPSHWRHQIPVFSQDLMVIVPDLRGHGRTDHPEVVSGPEFFTAATNDMAQLISSLDCGPVHVCGYSMGSSIAAWLYFQAPSLVKSLILVSGAARVNREIAPRLFELWERMSQPELMDENWTKALTCLHGQDKWCTLLRNYSSAVITRIEAEPEIAYTRGREIICPTLIVQGSDDQLNSVLLSEELHASIPNSELVLLESEHWVPGLQPERFNQEVLDFLQRRFWTESLA